VCSNCQLEGIGDCAICKDEFEKGVDYLEMPCTHIFHPDCILPWLDIHNSCPVCRLELKTDDADYEARKTQPPSENTT
jgi:E3 ubiquitin-protein ligase RNF115/126